MISIKIEGIFEPEQVRIRKSIDKEDFGRKRLLRADSKFLFRQSAANRKFILMLKNYLLIIVLLFFTEVINAQRTDYEPLKAIGPIPSVITELYTPKYLNATKSIQDDLKRKQRKLENDFHKRNQYFLDELLTSGEILYGDPITNYVQKVVDYLLQNYGETNKNFRVLTVRSPLFNAAATEEGILLVNHGLIAQVENEAQLAFILAHEIIHTEENHSIDGYIQKIKIEKNESSYRNQSSDKKLLALSTYSKAREYEADGEGFKRLYAKTNYDYEEALRLLDVMLYSYLPFDEKPIDPTFLNTPYFRLDSSFFPTTVNSITAYEDYDDSKSTHPNIKARREALEKIISTYPKGGKKWFIVDENAFHNVQELARFENSSNFLRNRNYPEAVYNSFLLLQKHPDNKYLRRNIGMALHTFSTYKNNQNTSFMVDAAKIEGNKHSVYTLFDRLTDKSASILAVHYNFANHKLYPDDPFLKWIFEKSLTELIYFHEITDEDFETEGLEAVEIEEEDTEFEEDMERSGRSGKVSKLRKTKRLQQDQYSYAFVEAFADIDFKSIWDQKIKEFEEHKNQTDYLSWKEKRVFGKKPEGFYKKSYRKKKESVKIEKVVVVTPKLLRFKEKPFKKDEVDIMFEKTDQHLQSIREALPDYLKQVNIESEILDYKMLDETDIDKFNDLMIVKDWMKEYWAHPQPENMVSNSYQVDAFIEKYGTQYIMFTGVISRKSPGVNKFKTLIYGLPFSLFFPPYIPNYALILISPIGNFKHYIYIYDIKNGRTIFQKVDTGSRAELTNQKMHALLYEKIVQAANH
ncbi:MAG: M48 family metallopeptidase [Cryomorphaceae bacterium]|nr:M48 family metallopeptidase [Cryomorphaceae bacterium]